VIQDQCDEIATSIGWMGSPGRMRGVIRDGVDRLRTSRELHGFLHAEGANGNQGGTSSSEGEGFSAGLEMPAPEKHAGRCGCVQGDPENFDQHKTYVGISRSHSHQY
jgi:hypothetical protein